MAYSNYINDFNATPLANPVVEPVTVAEAKSYCRVSSSAEDDLFAILIASAREAVEVATGLSLVPKSVIVYFNNVSGNFEMPFGPYNSSFALFDMNQDGLQITGTDYELIGDDFHKLSFPHYANLKATYQAGYSIIPADLKLAILDQVSYDYENRGLDADTGICNKTWKACQRWTRISPIL